MLYLCLYMAGTKTATDQKLGYLLCLCAGRKDYSAGMRCIPAMPYTPFLTSEGMASDPRNTDQMSEPHPQKHEHFLRTGS